MHRVETPTSLFRQLLRDISFLLAYEPTRDPDLGPLKIKTPLKRATAPGFGGGKLRVIEILLAGDVLLDGVPDRVSNARVGHVDVHHNSVTMVPDEYYFKIPEELSKHDIIIADPMLATGNLVAAAVKAR